MTEPSPKSNAADGPPPPPRWEHFEHEADMGVRGVAPTIEGAFEQAALAVTAVVTDPSRVAQLERVEIQCEAPDAELLLVDWLNEIVRLMAVRDALYSRFAVRIDGTRLRGEAWGEPVEPARHQPAVEVKGATFTALRVARTPGGQWLAQCVVDV